MFFVLFCFSDEIDTIDDDTTPKHKSTPEKMKTVSESLSPYDALKDFQMKNVRENTPRENVYISRLEGSEELKRDILGLYKDPRKNLRAPIKVRFDGEEGVGAGPVRQFFESAMKIPMEGMSSTGRPVVYFEGEKDHLRRGVRS